MDDDDDEVIFVEVKKTTWYGKDFKIIQEPPTPWAGECLLYLQAVRVTKTTQRDTVRVKYDLPQILIRTEKVEKEEKCVFENYTIQ